MLEIIMWIVLPSFAMGAITGWLVARTDFSDWGDEEQDEHEAVTEWEADEVFVDLPEYLKRQAE